MRRFAERHGARTFKLVPRSLVEGDATGKTEGDEQSERVFVEVTAGAERRMLRSLADAFVDVENIDDRDVDFSVEEEEEYDDYYDEEDTAEHVGEAAKYGILYDDRHYDYTKHLRTVGALPGGVIVAAPTAPKVNEQDFWRELHQLDAAIHKDIKAVVDDPAVLEVLEALEDEAYCDGDLQDDLVGRLEGYTLSDTSSDHSDCEDEYIDVESPYNTEHVAETGDREEDELQKILQEMDDQQSFDDSADDLDVEDAELIKSVARQEQEPLMTTEERKAANKKLGYAQVDELREALRENGGLLRLPADDLSDFDSDEYFRELEESDEDTFTPINNTNNKTAPNKPQMIEVIRLNKRTGLPSHKPTVTTPPPTSSDPESDPDPKVNLGASRKRGETAEEKKARKAAVKTARKERRGEKKENKMIFKQ